MNQVKFVILKYPEMNLLINECQLSAGIRLEAERRISGIPDFIETVILFNDMNIAVLDLANYLKKNYGLLTEAEESTAFIIDLRQFRGSTIEIVTKVLKKNDEIDKPLRYLAVKVNNAMESTYVSLEEIKLLPNLVRERCSDYGVIGTCFHKEKGNCYLVDLNNLIVGCCGTGGG